MAPDTTVSNQGTIHYDADGDGTNEATRLTDSPAAGGAADPTTFVVQSPAIAEIPTVGEWGLILLALMLGAAGACRVRAVVG